MANQISSVHKDKITDAHNYNKIMASLKENENKNTDAALSAVPDGWIVFIDNQTGQWECQLVHIDEMCDVEFTNTRAAQGYGNSDNLSTAINQAVSQITPSVGKA